MKRILCINIIFILCVASRLTSFVSAESVDFIEINVAESDIIQGYAAIILAEQNGVDIINLVKDLNEAIDLLSEARIYYGRGDYNAALPLVAECKEISNVVWKEATTLHISAVEESEQKFFQSFILTRVSIIIIFFSFVFLWKIFKQAYIKKLLGMKPMVEYFES